MNKIVFITPLIILYGCTSTGSIKSKQELIGNNQGQVVAQSASFLADLNPLGTKVSIGIKGIDDEVIPFNSLIGYPTEATLDAGEHTITFNCYWYQDSLLLSDKDGFQKTFSIEAGTQYLVKPKLIGGGQCDGDVEEIQEKI